MKLALHTKDSLAVAVLLRLALNELLEPGQSHCRRPAVAGAYVRALPAELVPSLITVVVDRAGDDGNRAAALTELILRVRAAKGTFKEDSAIGQIVLEVFAVAGVDVGRGTLAPPPGWIGDARPFVLRALRETLPDDLRQALRAPGESLGLIEAKYPEVYRLLPGGGATDGDGAESA